MINHTGSEGACSWCGRENGARSFGQVVKVASVPDGNTITLEIPLYYAFDVTKTPQVTRINQHIIYHPVALKT